MRAVSLLYAVASFLVVNTLYAGFFYEFSNTSDIINYLKGFHEIARSLSLLPVQDYFGHSPEIFLTLYYRLLSLVVDKPSAELLLVIHSVTYSILFLFAAALFVKFALGRIHFSLYIYLLGSSLPGAALQLSRQAISFCIVILVISFVSKLTKRRVPAIIFGGFITPFFHLGSSLNFIQLLALSGKRYLVFLTTAVICSSSFSLAIGPVNFMSNIFFLIDVDSFSNRSINFLVLISIFLLTFNWLRLSRKHRLCALLMIFILCALSLWPYVFLFRVFYAMDYLFLPVFLYGFLVSSPRIRLVKSTFLFAGVCLSTLKMMVLL